jgi:hypothetical protein
MSRTTEVSPNQIIAFNLEKWRTQRGWTVPDTATKLGKLLGRRISQASYWAMERSVNGRRPKRFDADEIFAIARMFGIHVGLLFAPPINYALRPVRVRPKGAPASQSLSGALSLNFIMNTVENVPEGIPILAGYKPDRWDEPPLCPDNPVDLEVLKLAARFFAQSAPTSALEQEKQQNELTETLSLFSDLYTARQQKPPQNSGAKGKQRKRPHVSSS